MPRSEIISSLSNPLLKAVRRAIGRGELTEDGCCVAETFHLLEEALRSDCAIQTVLAAESVRSAVERHVRQLAGVKVAVVADGLIDSLASTESSQGVMALVRPPAWSLEQLLRGRSLVVVLDGIQDPGNAGAITRAAEAFGASGMLWLKGTVSPFNSKALRASAGSLFRVPLLQGMDSALARAALQQNKLDLYAGMPAGSPGGKVLEEADLTRKCGLIIGSEARGVSPAFRAAARPLSIPTVGVESLNAAVAAGIMLYEARRQRSRQP